MCSFEQCTTTESFSSYLPASDVWGMAKHISSIHDALFHRGRGIDTGGKIDC